MGGGYSENAAMIIEEQYRRTLVFFSRCQELHRSGQAERVRTDEFTLGMACLALFLNNYYRAEVVKISDQTVTVFFVDYGNSHEVATTEVFRATPDLLAIPKLVFCVQELDYLPNDRRRCFRFIAFAKNRLLLESRQVLLRTVPAHLGGGHIARPC